MLNYRYAKLLTSEPSKGSYIGQGPLKRILNTPPPPPPLIKVYFHCMVCGRRSYNIIIIITTRPKPAYGRRGLAGSGAKIQMK